MGFPKVKTADIERDMALRGWNQQELARQAKLSAATVNRFLRGSQRTAKTLKSIAYALDKPIDAYIAKGSAA